MSEEVGRDFNPTKVAIFIVLVVVLILSFAGMNYYNSYNQAQLDRVKLELLKQNAEALEATKDIVVIPDDAPAAPKSYRSGARITQKQLDELIVNQNRILQAVEGKK